jgi:SAM-dependent methyltransferase
MDRSASEPSWSEYYQKVGHRPPRSLLIQAAERFPAPGLAIDLGCGGGIETSELLRRGWHVVAIDQEPAAIEATLARVPAEARDRLTTRCAGFTEVPLPPADLIWSGLSLPFCPPEHFPLLAQKIIAALRPGGRLACDLFGIRHAWRDRAGRTFVTRELVTALLQPCEFELLSEVEEERETAFQGRQHWHGFDIIARSI